MDQLTGQNVQVVLGLLEGKGFDSVENPMIIVGTLCGGSLDSDFINPEACPVFGSDLVWEATKSELRKMRSSQEPLKVECFEYKDNGIRERLGYFVLSLRTAQIVPPDYDGNIKKNWHKLFGLRNDVKSFKPEILLSLIIEELKDSPADNNDNAESKENSDKSIVPSNLPKPYLIKNEGLIQLGAIETCQKLFILNITTGTVGNLHNLKKIKPSNDKKYFLSYKIFDNDIQSKPFKIDNKNFAINEKIVIRIRTSYDVLNTYLKYHSNFCITLKYCESILGETCVNYRSLIEAKNEENFYDNINNGKAVMTERFYMKETDKKNDTFNADERPFIDVKLQLQYFEKKKLHTENIDSDYSLNDSIIENKISEEFDTDKQENPPGDYCYKKKLQKTENYQEKLIDTCSKKNSSDPDIYHCYCLNISLNSVKLKSGLSVGHIEFRFRHPKADTMSTTHSKIPVTTDSQLKLKDIECKLNFVSSSDEIKRLLSIYPPKISVHADDSCIGQCVLDVEELFHHKELQCQYESNLSSNDYGEIGVVGVMMKLVDLGPYNRTDQQTWEDNFGPPILDDSLTYKIIDELETWKERQQKIFYIELKKKEERHLNRLSEEWKKRREVLESSLTCSIEQCKMLTDNLNSATNDLRTRRLQSMEKEAKLIKINEELKWTYDKKFQELTETSDKLQNEFTKKLSLLEEEKKDYEKKLSSLKIKNEELENIIKKQTDNLIANQKNITIQNQNTEMLNNIKLLEKKLQDSQKSKIYFKEEWGKAIREIQMLKNNNIEVQFETSKNEFKKKNNLEEILKIDTAELTNDKLLLNQIQREIDIIKPKSSYRTDIPDESYYPTTFDSCSRLNIDTDMSISTRKIDQQELKLQKLIDERDSLLKTGSYSSDDPIIINLDKEISSIMRYL